MSDKKNRVVVTGVGAVTPLGLTVDESWQSIENAKSGIGTITAFDAGGFDVRIAGEVKGFDPETVVPKKEVKKMDRFIHLSLGATAEAWEQSGLGELTEEQQIRCAALIGVGMGGLPAIEKTMDIVNEKGFGRMGPFFIPMVITNLASGQVSMKYKAKGPNYAISSACASGAHAIGEAKNYIERGICDIAIAGGSESVVCSLAIGGFNAMKALSRRNDEPEKASRPWDKGRDGFILSEGAATLILESEEHAKARGAKILCYLDGYGASSDAHHMTNPAPGGAGAMAAMKMAMDDAGAGTADIDYVNAHGTSTGVGDMAEIEAVKNLFGDDTKNMAVSSTKSLMGHALGAAGAIESVFSIQAIVKQFLPPTANLDDPDEGCDIDLVPHKGRSAEVNKVLNNSFGFGGTNACLIFSKQ